MTDYKAVRIEKKYHEMLADIAALENRSMSSMIEVLIRNERIKRTTEKEPAASEQVSQQQHTTH